MVTDQRIVDYRKRDLQRLLRILGIAVVLTVLAILSIAICPIKVTIPEAVEAFFKHIAGVEPDNYRDHIVDVYAWENIPRALCAILAGAVLASCGATIQSLIRNPLADPYTLGISSGALFGMVLWVILEISLVPFIVGSDAQFYNAFLMALIPTFIVIFISIFKKVTPTMMILTGIGVMYIFTAITTIIKYTADSDLLKDLYLWTVGTVNGMVWGSVPKILVAFLICFIPMIVFSRRIDIVSQGDTGAISLGVNPNRLRMIFLILTSVSTAIIVCYTGTIGFVGLVSPHVARMIVGSRSILLIPCSAVIGGAAVFLADCIVRLFVPTLSVGVILAIVCSPIFIYVLMKMKRSAW